MIEENKLDVVDPFSPIGKAYAYDAPLFSKNSLNLFMEII